MINATNLTVNKKAKSVTTSFLSSGNEPGFPDYMVFPFFERSWLLAKSGIVKIDLDHFPGAEYPKLHKWFSAMMQRPEVILSTIKQSVGKS